MLRRVGGPLRVMPQCMTLLGRVYGSVDEGDQRRVVAVPSTSASFANLIASDVARSVLAALTARMIEFGLLMYDRHMSLMICSMSAGWSPTATFVMPGRSMRESVRTRGE